MSAVLNSTVIVDGHAFDAGTEETAELREQIPNPAAWTELADGVTVTPEPEPEPEPEPAKPARGKRQA